MPGTGYTVTDNGLVERVRADYWADDFIRMVAATYPAPAAPPPPEERATATTAVETEVVAPVVAPAGDSATSDPATSQADADPAPATADSSPRPRAPRKPRRRAGHTTHSTEGAGVA